MTNRRQSDAIGELQYLADSPSKSFECYDNGRTTILHISSLLVRFTVLHQEGRSNNTLGPT